MFYQLKKHALFWFILLSFMLLGLTTALAAKNTVPVTHLMDQNSAIMLSELVPPECDSIRYILVAIVDCSVQAGSCSGFANSSELILGTSGNDVIDGKGGDDCIVGGGGDDRLYGDIGSDVLVGGLGNDFLYGDGRNKDTDICVDDPTTTYFDISCEITP